MKRRKRSLQSGRAVVVAAALVTLATTGFYACVFTSTSETNPGAADGPTAGPSSGAGTDTLDKRALLTSLGEKVFLPTYRDFAEAAAALESAAAAYADSGASADKEAAQQAWRDAMDIWQRAEVMRAGPAATMDAFHPGGQDLGDRIYSYPLLVNPCRVDQVLVEGLYADTSALSNQLVNTRGFDALEYLLFYEGTDNACAPQNDINSTGSWNGIVGELPERRADYAASAASILSDDADALVAAWEGEFLAELSQAGAGSSLFDSDQAALNAVSDALFYLDKVTKDTKLAVPTGLSDCPTETCPGELELRQSGHSKEAIVQNLEGFRMVLTGGPRGEASNLGFDDWLVAVGDPSLALDMIDRLDAAIAAAEAIEFDDLDAALADPEGLEQTIALYHAVKKVTDLLKADFITVLDLEVPQAAAGDND